MNKSSFLARAQMRVEMLLVGRLDPNVRYNMYMKVPAVCTLSVMATIITFIPTSCGGRVWQPNKWHIILRSPRCLVLSKDK